MNRALAGAALAAALLTAPPAAAAPRVTIASGTLAGTADRGVEIFKGIPYAAPPVGTLRWAPPAPPAAWKGVRDASHFGAACPQPSRPDNKPAAGADLPHSEDCLFLNVWAPESARRAPVMVWIHGGAFRVGSGASPIYDGDAFAKDGVVFVSINYRLGALGFFAHPALTRAAGPDAPLGNYGLMDQIAALRWVHRNIARFGGDPANVTIFGESAGGESVLFLMTTPAARGLFGKAIVESGGGWKKSKTLAQAEAAGDALASRAGLPGAKATLAQLRALPASETLDAPLTLGGVGPFEDGRLVKETPAQAFADGGAAPVPLIIGSNSFEASLMRTFRIPPQRIANLANDAVRRAYGEAAKDEAAFGEALFTDAVMGAPASWVAAEQSRRAPAYVYEFAYVPQALRAGSPGVRHGGEIPFVFDTLKPILARTGDTPTAEDRRMERIVHACWVAFAKIGTPKCPRVSWPRYDSARGDVLVFGPGASVVEHFRQARYQAIDQMLAPRRGAEPPIH